MGSRVDMHCHSSASAASRLGVQRALGLPECATDPEEVYRLAKRRGMDFVTITDHDTIAGVRSIADRPDVFVSEELTAHFRGEPQAVHVLCYGILAEQHKWLQRHASDVELCAEYLHGHGITCALAHPFYAVRAPLAPRHRRRLAELFPIWETRNGARATELNMPAAIYIDTHGGTGVGGSDDHAGSDIGRTFTETDAASTPAEFLAHLRAGRAQACGEQGSAAKWAHAALALAVRAVGAGDGTRPDPRKVLTMVERIMREAEARHGATGHDLSADDARDLLRAWLDAVSLELDEQELIAYLQSDQSVHTALFRRARRAHERKLQRAVSIALATTTEQRDYLAAALSLFEACIAALPYAPAAAFLGREKAKLVSREGEPRRVALIADGIGAMHGVTHTLDEIRERGVPGFEVDVIGTDTAVDRRLPTVCEVDIPFYAGLKVGVPGLPGLVDALAEGRYDAVHVCSPGPAGIGSALVARAMGLPVIGSYHTELAAYASMRAADPRVAAAVRHLLSAFYGSCELVLSPSAASDISLQALGVTRVARWERGVDVARFGRRHRVDGLLPGAVNVLYAGRLTQEKGMELLADAFLLAVAREPRLHLVLAGGGAEEDRLRERLGARATFLGWLEGDELARAYASADAFLFASRTDTFGQVILEAQASELAVVAVREGGPAALIEHGKTGLLCPPDAGALADAVVALARNRARRRRLGAAASEAVTARTWERALEQLATGYAHVLRESAGTRARAAA